MRKAWGQSSAGATTAGPAGPGVLVQGSSQAIPIPLACFSSELLCPTQLWLVARGPWGQGTSPRLVGCWPRLEPWTDWCPYPTRGHQQWDASGGSGTILRPCCLPWVFPLPPAAPQLPSGTQQQAQRGSISPGPASRE